MSIVVLLHSTSEHYSSADIAASARTAASDQGVAAVMVMVVAVAALAMATSAGRMLAAAIAAAFRTVAELIATLARLAGVSVVVVVLVGLLLYGLFD